MSKFEVVTAMAFAAFADAPVDVAVVEVGMGGRWDATNVVDAPVAVITPIGLDHIDYLGEHVAEIAGEKAGIIRKAADDLVPVDTVAVIGRQTPEAMEVLLAEAVRADAAVAREDSEFAVLGRQIAVGGQLLELQGLGGVYPEMFLPLHGEHQAHNAALALAAVEAFFGAGADRQLDVDAVRAGFAAVTSRGDSSECAARQRCSSMRRTTRRVPPRSPPRSARSSTSDSWSACLGDGGQGRRRHPGRARAGVRPDRRHPQRIAARAWTSRSSRWRAEERFGPERVVTATTLADAIETATALVEESGNGRRLLRRRHGDHRLGGHRGRGAHLVRAGPGMTEQPPDDAVGQPAPPDPWRSFRGVMAGTLILEAIVVLLALPVVSVSPGRADPAQWRVT